MNVRGNLLTNVYWWRGAVAVSFLACVLRSGVFSETGSGIGWYALQFGPIAVATALLLLVKPDTSMRRTDWLILGSLAAVVATAALSAATSISASTTLAQAGIFALMAAFLALTYWRRWGDRAVISGDLIWVFAIIVAVETAGLTAALFRAPFAFGYYDRFTGLLSNANYAGMLACVAIPLAIYVYRQSFRWLAGTGIAISIVSLFLSGSRGALAACALGVIFLIAFLPARKMLISVGILVLLGVAYLLAAPLITGTLAQSFTRESQASDVTSGRVEIWGDMIHAWSGSPITGYGYRTTEILTDGLSGHNTYLAVLTETGILGALAFVALLVLVCIGGQWRTADRVIVATVIAIAVMEATESSIFGWGGPTALSGWLIVLAFAAFKRSDTRQDAAPPEAITPERIG